MKFCTQCGRKLEDGELCMCSGAVAMRAKSAQNVSGSTAAAPQNTPPAGSTGVSGSQVSLQKGADESSIRQQSVKPSAPQAESLYQQQSTPQNHYQQSAPQGGSTYQQQSARPGTPQNHYQQSAPQGGSPYQQQNGPQNHYQQSGPQGGSPYQQQNARQNAPQGGYGRNSYAGAQGTGSFRETIAAFKNRVGIGEPERNDTDWYERGMRIVPDCIEPDQGEVPVRQYDIAILRTRAKFQKAEGRLQVTNKRVLFRATGRSLMGRTALQYEFDINKISGIEVRRDHRFSFMNLIGCMLLFTLVASIMFAVVTGLAYNGMRNSGGNGGLGFITALCIILGIASVVPFFMVYKKFILKHLSLSAGVAVLAAGATLQRAYAYFGGGSGSAGFLTILTVLVGIIWIINICIICFVPNLRMIIKNREAESSVDIRRMRGRSELSGFMEVLPWKDTERAINELGALINDLQTSEEKAVAKWKNK
ncbi:MAG: hypothetical protein Q4B15_04020 [Lachnospiraceae bacterium]|nr:hypothetical protein [Lachnospiraceae bacterium]